MSLKPLIQTKTKYVVEGEEFDTAIEARKAAGRIYVSKLLADSLHLNPRLADIEQAICDRWDEFLAATTMLSGRDLEDF
jgi:hypothetical protein